MAASSAGHGPPPAPEPLPQPVVDNHAHLDIVREEGVALDLPDALAAAAAVGVDRIVHIGCDLESAEAAVVIAHRYAAIVAGVALHPNEAPALAARGELGAAYARIEELAGDDRVRVVGETGLDYFRTGPDGVGAQHDSFRWHIDLAKRLGKTLQIHDRDSHADVLRILDEEGAPARTVMHCFSGDADFAKECLDRGFFLSFAGTLTFKNATALRAAAAITPLERLLVETDAPYLTPHPWRGAVDASYLLPLTVRALAGARGVALDELVGALSANAQELYGPW